MAIVCVDSALAWAIGIFEGEGSIIISNRHGGSSPTVSLAIQMTDMDVLQRFFTIVKLGRMAGPYRPKRKGNTEYKTVWKWSANSINDIQELLMLWLPLLGNRRKRKAIEALELLKNRVKRRPRLMCFKGHLWTKSNTWTSKKTGFRMCKACREMNNSIKVCYVIAPHERT